MQEERDHRGGHRDQQQQRPLHPLDPSAPPPARPGRPVRCAASGRRRPPLRRSRDGVGGRRRGRRARRQRRQFCGSVGASGGGVGVPLARGTASGAGATTRSRNSGIAAQRLERPGLGPAGPDVARVAQQAVLERAADRRRAPLDRVRRRRRRPCRPDTRGPCGVGASRRPTAACACCGRSGPRRTRGTRPAAAPGRRSWPGGWPSRSAPTGSAPACAAASGRCGSSSSRRRAGRSI